MSGRLPVLWEHVGGGVRGEEGLGQAAVVVRLARADLVPHPPGPACSSITVSFVTKVSRVMTSNNVTRTYGVDEGRLLVTPEPVPALVIAQLQPPARDVHHARHAHLVHVTVVFVTRDNIRDARTWLIRILSTTSSFIPTLNTLCTLSCTTWDKQVKYFLRR